MYGTAVPLYLKLLVAVRVEEVSGGNCIKIALPGKLILGYYYMYQENRTSRRPFLLLRISFPGRPIFIQFIPDLLVVDLHVGHLNVVLRVAAPLQVLLALEDVHNCP